MPNRPLSNLGGEASPDSWDFTSSHGPLPYSVGHTFPLLTHDPAGVWQLVGTGFYVSDNGLFVTAGHVIDEVIHGEKQVAPLAIMHLQSQGAFGPHTYLLRPIGQCWYGENVDIVLGAAASASHRQSGIALSNPSLRLSWAVPSIGAATATYAFPNHAIGSNASGQAVQFRPDMYRGVVLEADDFRDAMLVPYPYLYVNFRIHGAASGGPVFARDGVAGINTRFLEPDGPGVVAQIRCLQDSFIDDVITSPGASPRRVTFAEFAALGWVDVADFKPDAVPKHSGRLVRLDAVAITAEGPAVSVDLYG